MRYKSILNLVSLVICAGIFFFVSNECALAQKKQKEPRREKEFGWSLKKFEQKTEDGSKDKETNQKNPERDKVSDEEIIRIETDLVINDVLVVNEKGNAVIGLKQSDFVITEDGEPQKVELFSFGENAALPRSIVLIMRSVSKNDYAWTKNALEGLKALVDKLAPQDKMAIATTDLKLILNFTQDKALLKKTLEQLLTNPKAESLIAHDYATLMAVLSEMFDEKDVRPIVIFMAAGAELSFLKGEFSKLSEFYLWKENKQRYEARSGRKYEERFGGGERAYSFNDVLREIEKSRATIYSIQPTLRFVGLPEEEQLRRARIIIEEWMKLAVKERDPARISAAQKEYQLIHVNDYVKSQTAVMQTAKLSGGYTEFIEQPEDAQRVFETVFTVINNRYTIGYYPTNQTKDGKRRNVKIEVRNHPEYTIVGRKTYIAAKSER